MFGFEMELDAKVDGSKHHPLVKIGGAMAGLPFVILGNYFPLATAVKLIFMNVPNPVQQFPWWTWLMASAFLLCMFAFGSHCIAGMTCWLADERLSRKQCRLIVAAISALSLAVATTAFVMGQWATVMLAAFAGTFVFPLAAGPVIYIGQMLGGRMENDTT
ncbi:MAG: hypothetical protein ACQESR_02440 [Planctomycetota bacterium]